MFLEFLLIKLSIAVAAMLIYLIAAAIIDGYVSDLSGKEAGASKKVRARSAHLKKVHPPVAA